MQFWCLLHPILFILGQKHIEGKSKVMSSLVLLPKGAITIWQGWTRRLWVSISAGSYQSTGPSAVFFYKDEVIFVFSKNYKLSNVLFNVSRRMLQLFRPSLRGENEEGKKRSAGQKMHVHLLLLFFLQLKLFRLCKTERFCSKCET